MNDSTLMLDRFPPQILIVVIESLGTLLQRELIEMSTFYRARYYAKYYGIFKELSRHRNCRAIAQQILYRLIWLKTRQAMTSFLNVTRNVERLRE